ncbi:MAG: hypothetical protein ACK46X_00545, partial [Candidatus Sericytochromatia bacterium]
MVKIPPFRAAGLAFLAILATMLAPALAQGRLLAPTEAMALYYPLRVLAGASVAAGEWPFWNPYQFGGFPLLAALQGGVFFPANWTFWVLPPQLAMNVTVAAAYAVAGLSTLAFGRAIGLPAVAAHVTALAFAFGGFFVAHKEHLGKVQAASLLPALLWAIERFRADPTRSRWAVVGAGILALQILTGHPQMVVFSLLVAVPYAAWRGIGLAGKARYAGALLAMGALGVGLCAVQLLPSLALIAESQRQAFPYDMLVAESVAPRQLIGLWMPFLYGAPPSGPFPTPPWGGGPWFNETVGYVGLATLVLAAVGLSRWRAEPQVRFWAIVALMALMLALGGSTPLYQLWAQVPVLQSMRAPGRHLLELTLAVAMLAGHGTAALSAGAVSSRALTMAWGAVGLPVVAVFAGLAIAGPSLAARLQPFMPASVDLSAAFRPTQPALWLPVLLWLVAGALAFGWLARRGHAWPIALVALLVADVWVFVQFQGWRQLSPPAAQVPVAAPRETSEARFVSVAADGYPYRDFDRVRALPAAGYNSLTGDRATHGYDAFIKSRYAALMGDMTHGGVMPHPAVWEPGHHGLDVLGTRHLHLEVALLDDPAWRRRLAGDRWRPLGRRDGVATFENRRALPRAWRPERAVLMSPERVDAAIQGDLIFDPTLTALHEMPLSRTDLSGGTASVRMLSANRLRLDTAGAGPGLVVVSEAYDAGWQAWQGERRLP